MLPVLALTQNNEPLGHPAVFLEVVTPSIYYALMKGKITACIYCIISPAKALICANIFLLKVHVFNE